MGCFSLFCFSVGRLFETVECLYCSISFAKLRVGYRVSVATEKAGGTAFSSGCVGSKRGSHGLCLPGTERRRAVCCLSYLCEAVSLSQDDIN